MLKDLMMILLAGYIGGKILGKCKLPPLLGMLFAGVLIGPHFLDLLSEEVIKISEDIRLLALIIILLRAGLGLHRETLEKVGVLSLKLGSIPCLLEGFLVMGLGVLFFDLGWIEAGIMGFIIAAVSPAVIVPSMLKLMEHQLGEKKGIPAMILAGASIDDVFAITLISIFIGMWTTGEGLSAASFLSIPREIFGGVLVGVVIGLLLSLVYRKWKMEGSEAMLFLVIGALAAYVISDALHVAGLLAVMVAGVFLLEKNALMAQAFSKELKGVWVFGEIFLFVLIGSIVDVGLALTSGPLGILMILLGFGGRLIGVMISTIGSPLNQKERIFTGIAYFPKATVQAAMGALPLSLGIEGGELILAISVLAVVITAPVGAFAIDRFSKKLLEENPL